MSKTLVENKAKLILTEVATLLSGLIAGGKA